MYGLVLEGGGAKGSYHIGAYKAILEEGIEISGVSGTSIGALNGAMIVQGDFETCYSLWDELSASMLLIEEENIFLDLAEASRDFEDLKLLGGRFLNILKGRGFGTEQFKNLLDKYIDEDRVRSSNMDFGLSTFNLTDMKAVEITIDEIPAGELKNYLLASAYLPVFKGEKLGGKRYLDGAFYDNLPFKILQNLGYNKLILVRTHAKGITRKLNREECESIVISPSDDIGYSFTFDAEIARRNMKLGYYDALRAFRNLEGRRYYIEPYKEENPGLDFFMSLENARLDRINETIGIKYNDRKRNLFEYSLPKLGSILGIGNNFSYDELFIALLEKKAESLEIDRFQIYSLKELLDLVSMPVEESEALEDKELGILEKIIEKVDLASSFNKENLLLEVVDIIFRKEL